MTDLLTITGTSIRTLLLDYAPLLAAVNQKIYQVVAPGNTVTPYVVFNHVAGGMDNVSPTKSFDIQFLVTGVAKTQTEARQLATYIETALVDKEPIFSDSFRAVTNITVLDPFLQFTDLQNDQFWRAGAYYRLRGAKN